MSSPDFVWRPDQLAWLQRSVLCWLATVDETGMPHVSPKELFVPQGERQLLIAHLASPKSVRNLQHHPLACVSCVDVLAQKGLKMQGRARVVLAGTPAFETLATPLVAMAGGRFVVRGVIELTVDRVEPIVAPSYRFYPETDEATQIRSAWQQYAARSPIPLN
jgi:predicted pyridoxine 5'-phosphate oxidase superfamily flavin-nucleotide-binding protein